MVYLVCAIQKPTKKEEEDEGKVATIIGEVKAMVAQNDQMAGIAYVQEFLPSAKLDNIEVLVRLFC